MLYKAVQLIYYGLQQMEIFGLSLSFLLNFSLVIDLIIMMKYPFSDKSKYMSKYLLVSFGGAFLFSLGVTNELTNKATTVTFQWLLLLIWIGFLIAGTYSIVTARLVLSKPGISISGSARRLILVRHTTGIILYTICNLYVFVYILLSAS